MKKIVNIEQVAIDMLDSRRDLYKIDNMDFYITKKQYDELEDYKKADESFEEMKDVWIKAGEENAFLLIEKVYNMLNGMSVSEAAKLFPKAAREGIVMGLLPIINNYKADEIAEIIYKMEVTKHEN